MLLFKVKCSAFKVDFVLVLAFTVSQAHDLGIARAMLYCLDYKKSLQQCLLQC